LTRFEADTEALDELYSAHPSKDFPLISVAAGRITRGGAGREQ
jgi:hypothetical protein